MWKISVMLAFVVVGVVAIVIFGIAKPVEVAGSSESNVTSAPTGKAAPELISGQWFNSEPLTLAGLRGRVVYIEFWTFGCSNCINTLPTVKRFDATYREKGLTVIGIQSPEFEHEKASSNIENALKKRGIEYPILTDNEMKNWDRYGVTAWPTIFIIDKNGRIRYEHVGEGAYDKQESVIKQLLEE
ncbi:MAG TPA: redoxin domain-containing protein [Pyrinomonadaceae bacterium]|nr:redoxin domain-containing protein [Pyrinomonadaceae bacterium]